MVVPDSADAVLPDGDTPVVSASPHVAVGRLTEAVVAMGSLADDLVRRWWPELPDEVVAGLEEIARCRSAALRDLPAEVPVEGGEADCEDGVAGTLLSLDIQRRPVD